MDSELQRFEAELERLSPGSLPEGLISRMEAAMESWEESSEDVSPETDKVVPFPKLEEKAEAAEVRRAARGRSSFWGAAASVALLGSVAGILFSTSPQRDDAGDRDPAFVPAESVANIEFAPEDARRTLVATSSEDLFIANRDTPLRVIRLDYVDRYVFRGANGELLYVDFPARNYNVVPVQTD